MTVTPTGTGAPDAARTEEADAILAQLLLTPESYANPYPLQHQLRALAPVYRSQMGFWIISRYEDVNSVLRSPRIGRDIHKFMAGRFGGRWEDHPALRRLKSTMLWSNGEDHRRLRKLVSHAFTPRRVHEMHASIEGFTAEMLDPIAERGEGDLLNEFAFPLPLLVVATMLGVPREEAPALREPIEQFLKTFELGMTADDLLEADKGTEQTQEYFTHLIEERRANPRDDMLTDLIAAEEEGGRLSFDELMAFCNAVIAAGFETTTSAISSVVWYLWRDPEVLAAITEDRKLIPGAVEEVLRMEPPAGLSPRMTFEPVEYGGVTIPEGEVLIAMLSSANRDPERFPDPDRFDIRRTDNAHLSFSAGIHHCLGVSLAKMELEIVVNALLDRFSAIEFLEQPVFRPRMTLRSMESLRVRLTAR